MNVIPFHVEGRYFTKMLSLYCFLFGTDPEVIKRQIERHSRYPNFEGYLALKNKKVMGYIYGYTSIKGQYYHDLMAQHLNPYHEWLEDCMELAELGVHPHFRRQGIAHTLMSLLLQRRRENKAVLTVRKNNDSAVSFYQKKGWILLGDGFYPKVPQEYIIMGKVL